MQRCSTFAELPRGLVLGFNFGGTSQDVPDQTNVLVQAMRGRKTFCETGFQAGHSALAILRAHPAAIVHSFDLDHPSKRIVAECLNATWGGRLHMHWGDSRQTLPKAPAIRCDTVFVDGGHEDDIPELDLFNFRRLATLNTTLIVDDVNCERVDYCTTPHRALADAERRGEVAIEHRFAAKVDLAAFRPGFDSYTRGFSVGGFLATPGAPMAVSAAPAPEIGLAHAGGAPGEVAAMRPALFDRRAFDTFVVSQTTSRLHSP